MSSSILRASSDHHSNLLPLKIASLLIITRISSLSRFLREIPSGFPFRRILIRSSPICCYSSSSSSAQFETLAPETAPEPNYSPLQWLQRMATCGELGLGDVGKRVTLCGWVALRRIHGGLTFLNLRDQSGIVQVNFF